MFTRARLSLRSFLAAVRPDKDDLRTEEAKTVDRQAEYAERIEKARKEAILARKRAAGIVA